MSLPLVIALPNHPDAVDLGHNPGRVAQVRSSIVCNFTATILVENQDLEDGRFKEWEEYD